MTFRPLHIYKFLTQSIYTIYTKQYTARSVFFDVANYFKPLLCNYYSYPFFQINHRHFKNGQVDKIIPYIRVCNGKVWLYKKKLYFSHSIGHYRIVKPQMLIKMLNLLIWAIASHDYNYKSRRIGLFTSEWNYIILLEKRHASNFLVSSKVNQFLNQNRTSYAYSIFYLYSGTRSYQENNDYLRNYIHNIYRGPVNRYLSYIFE